MPARWHVVVTVALRTVARGGGCRLFRCDDSVSRCPRLGVLRGCQARPIRAQSFRGHLRETFRRQNDQARKNQNDKVFHGWPPARNVPE